MSYTKAMQPEGKEQVGGDVVGQPTIVDQPTMPLKLLNSLGELSYYLYLKYFCETINVALEATQSTPTFNSLNSQD